MKESTTGEIGLAATVGTNFVIGTTSVKPAMHYKDVVVGSRAKARYKSPGGWGVTV